MDKNLNWEDESEVNFLVATNLDYFGDEATGEDIKLYAEFAEEYLLTHGFEKVSIEFVQHYPSHDEQYELRQKVWEAFCGQ